MILDSLSNGLTSFYPNSKHMSSLMNLINTDQGSESNPNPIHISLDLIYICLFIVYHYWTLSPKLEYSPNATEPKVTMII